MAENAIETADNGIAEIRGIVRAMVAEFGNAGISRAIAATAETLCLGLRRTRGYYHGEIRSLPPHELEDVRIAYLGYLRQRHQQLERTAASVEAYLRKHERAAA